MEDMKQMDDSLPEGTTEVTDPKYAVGSYVKPLVAHMADQEGKSAKVLKACTGTFYIVDFEDGNGPHKWYAEGELEVGTEPEGDNKDNSKMNMSVWQRLEQSVQSRKESLYTSKNEETKPAYSDLIEKHRNK